MHKNYPAAYQPSKGSALQIDKPFYERIRAEQGKRTLIEQFEVPIRTGRAWHVPAGHVFRVTTPVGPQVGDFNVWNAHDPRERCGLRVLGNSRALMSAPTTGCGRTCRSCGLW